MDIEIFRDLNGIRYPRNLYASEHGPGGNDEINIIEPGSNYGWPLEVCNESSSSTTIRFKTPVFCFNPGVGPSGLTIVCL